MSGKSVSEFGKGFGVQSQALIDGKRWFDALMKHEFQGRGDRDKRARGQIADDTGVPESYLFRLQYKMKDMRDISGEVYRRLMLRYDEICRAHENAADDKRQRRGEITDAVHQSSAAQRSRDGAALVGREA